MGFYNALFAGWLIAGVIGTAFFVAGTRKTMEPKYYWFYFVTLCLGAITLALVGVAFVCAVLEVENGNT
jgi:hypothetical protein